MVWWWLFVGIVLLFGLVVFRGAPYVPSKRRDIRIAFTKLYPLDKADVLVDIGSGDGVVLRVAATYGSRAVGYELNPVLVLISRLLSRGNPRVETHWKDYWHVEMPSDTTVVYAFGVGRDIERMASKVEEQATRIGRSITLLSYGFEVESRKPDRKVGAYYRYDINPSLHSGEP